MGPAAPPPAPGPQQSPAPAAPGYGSAPGNAGPGWTSGALAGPGSTDAGWARTAGYLGIGTAVVVGGLTAATVASDEDQDTALPLGIVTTVIGGVMIPVVAIGAGSARDNPAVVGLPTLRTSSWVSYGLALADALVLIGLSIGETPASPLVTGSVGVLGVLSCTGMTLDAFESASQAEDGGGLKAAGSGVRVAPFIVPVDRRRPGMVVGLRGVL